MKHKHIPFILTGLLILFGPQTTKAQSQALIDSIELNNPTLRSLRARLHAEKLRNEQSLRLPDPEAEVDYMLGSPKGIPNRTNVSVSQSLDWGVITGRRRGVATAANERATAAYGVERQQVMAGATAQLVECIYYNRLCAELTRRKEAADEVKRLYTQKFEAGEANQIELNKVRLSATMAEAELSRAAATREAVMLSLQQLNGGKPVVCPDTAYAETTLPSPSLWRGASALSLPAVKTAQAAVDESRHAIRLAKAEGAPSLSVGFTGEYISQNNYSGVSLGMSLPLWGNTRKRVKAAQAELMANQIELDKVQGQTVAQLDARYAEAVRLCAVAERLKTEIAALGSSHLLKRSLEEGRISLIDYVMEQTFVYDALTAQLEAERDARKAVALLNVLLEQ